MAKRDNARIPLRKVVHLDFILHLSAESTMKRKKHKKYRIDGDFLRGWRNLKRAGIVHKLDGLDCNRLARRPVEACTYQQPMQKTIQTFKDFAECPLPKNLRRKQFVIYKSNTSKQSTSKNRTNTEGDFRFIGPI